MGSAGIDAMLLTTEPEVRYFSGFQSQFWESPTRPWFLVVPRQGRPTAVIPEIGVAGMRQTWVEDIRSWSAPDPRDDGISLLGLLLSEICTCHGCFGMPMGHETCLRMPLADFELLRDRTRHIELVDATAIIRTLRSIKSEAEIDKIRRACDLTSAGFRQLPSYAASGQSERKVCRRFKGELLHLGADGSPYLIGASGYGGYDNIIMGPTDRQLGQGDVLIIDTGTTYDGYFCDFDRNFAFGDTTDAAKRAYEVVYHATEMGIQTARPGATHAELYHAMWDILQQGGAMGNDVGRLGHGLGMQLTEGASTMPGDETVLAPGMVITIEPGMSFAPGKLMVHEENIVIREGDAELLTRRADPELPCIT
jgi:Xaa-Pro aminopeptidase